ncbi:MAG: TonB-dependent receptor [Acetobacteraceae bacterium]|nr:TonB-dependent receptor [Acetobacteraceae bacterium]
MAGAAPALAHGTALSLPAGRLDQSLTALSRATGVEIVSIEPGLRAVATRPVRGTLSTRNALERLLRGTGYQAVAIPGGGFRVVRASPTYARRRSHSPSLEQPTADVVVTGSKQLIPLLRYPGSVTRLNMRALTGIGATADLSQVARALPVLESTALGPGRNKLFIRGVADSSFNGSTQAPTSLYLDDVQLTYSGPDPALRLYDMHDIEVLEGPQGTLYGAGAIGGVVRMTSNPVDLSGPSAAISTSATATQGGAAGYDLAGMVNAPLVRDRFGLRGVGYAVRDGGYIDDPRRRLRDLNVTDTVGGRLVLRFDPGAGWRGELGGAAQWIDMRDGQYGQRGLGVLARASRLPQPFDNQLLFARATIAKEWPSGLRLFAATGVTGSQSTEQFDATQAPPTGTTTPVLYTAQRNKLLLNHETRLSRTSPSGESWVAGLTLISDRDALSRTLNTPGGERSIIGVTNLTRSASAFGEVTLPVLASLAVTAGARATIGRTDGSPSSRPREHDFVSGRGTARVDPTLSASWRLASQWAGYARFQTGYRTGGLAVAPGVGRVADYRPDSIMLGELGMRRVRAGRTGLSLSADIAHARWINIQADLVNRRGQPYTANLGDALITTAEGAADLVTRTGLRVEAAFLLADTRVRGAIIDQSARNSRNLPETPPFAARAALSYGWRARGLVAHVGGSGAYVGPSALGFGDLFDIGQEGRFTLGADVGARIGRVDLSVAADNLTNSRANQFAFGNPFGFAARDQVTPLRPRNLRIAAQVAW